ncbi:MAG TPA: DUF2508 domain-containing protein [Lachnospiraceae bacterium]|nr:DUF2508 domain-containing protein [Lachnospiraceae bacterium]
MKLFQAHRQKAAEAADRILLDEIQKAKSQMETAYINFQDALEPDLIDYYIYAGNAAWKRYCFLLHQVREQ